MKLFIQFAFLAIVTTACGPDKYVGSLADYPGEKEGLIRSYHDNGTLFEEAQFVNGQYHGYRKIYFYYGDDKLETHETYENGIFHGPFKKYFDNGKLKVEGDYVNGTMSGIWKSYYESGELKEEVMMSDNLENGPFKEYHKNGELEAVGNYVNGEFENGLLQLFDSTGTLIKKMECDTGICRTIWTIEEQTE